MGGLRGEEISAARAREMLREGTLLLVDVREADEWDLVHIAGSVHVPLGELEARADEIEPGPGQAVAFLCHHGVRSLRAALAARALGRVELAGAVSVAGGIEAWAGVDAGVARYERGRGGVKRLGGP